MIVMKWRDQIEYWHVPKLCLHSNTQKMQCSCIRDIDLYLNCSETSMVDISTTRFTDYIRKWMINRNIFPLARAKLKKNIIYNIVCIYEMQYMIWRCFIAVWHLNTDMIVVAYHSSTKFSSNSDIMYCSSTDRPIVWPHWCFSKYAVCLSYIAILCMTCTIQHQSVTLINASNPIQLMGFWLSIGG